MPIPLVFLPFSDRLSFPLPIPFLTLPPSPFDSSSLLPFPPNFLQSSSSFPPSGLQPCWSVNFRCAESKLLLWLRNPPTSTFRSCLRPTTHHHTRMRDFSCQFFGSRRMASGLLFKKCFFLEPISSTLLNGSLRNFNTWRVSVSYTHLTLPTNREV